MFGLIFIVHAYSQNCSDRWHAHRSLKYICKEWSKKSMDHLDSIKWKRNLDENAKIHFKVFYAEVFNSEVGILDSERVISLDGSKVEAYFTTIDSLIENYNSLKKYHSRFEKKYCLNFQRMDDIRNLLLKRRYYLEAQDSLRREKEIQQLEYERHELRKNAARDSMNMFIEHKATVMNAIMDNESLNTIMRMTSDSNFVEVSFEIDDSTMTYKVQIGFFSKTFGTGAYYDPNIYSFLAQTFSEIVRIHSERSITCSATGTADGLSVGDGISYPSKIKNWGNIGPQTVLLTTISKDSITIDTNMSVSVGEDVINNQLAFLRAYIMYDIINDLGRFSQNINFSSFLLKDFTIESDKIGEQYRTAGFVVIVAHDFFNDLTSQEKAKIGLGKPGEIYINESGRFVPIKVSYED